MIGVKAIANSWGISARRVGQLCNAGEIEGAIKVGGLWKIPADAPRPAVLRNKKRANRIQTTKLLPCPVGITSYKEVSSECYYVDKTLLIKDIIDDHNKVTLFTRPRRFGKTLTMDMVKTYFEKTDEDTSVYFSNRAIWKCSDSYKSYQGAYPVIFLSFKDIKYNSWENANIALQKLISQEFCRHDELANSPKLSANERQFYQQLATATADTVDYQMSLRTLAMLLNKHYDSRVVVIIDEYDTPIQQGYSNGYYDQIIAVMRNLLSAVLKDNDALEFGILTGILRVAKESLFSGLNNLIVNTISDGKYSDYFGFTIHDVEEMAAYYGQTEKLPELRDWYDGYLFGNTELYNPWSVISYFNNNCNPKAFWSRTSSNDMILEIIRSDNPEMRKSLMNLLQGNPVQAVVDTDILYPEIGTSEDSVYSFLLMTGYLKIAETLATLDDNPVCNLLIPNKEIKFVFKKEILENLSKTMNQSVMRDFRLALKSNNREALQNTLRQYLLQSASNFDTAKENFYHGMMLGLLAIMSDDYLVSSNCESGEGRFDIQLKPLSKLHPGILMEFKAAKDADEKKLSELADEAIEQAQIKQYAAEMKASDLSEIQIYGIAFSNKKATVKTTKLICKKCMN